MLFFTKTTFSSREINTHMLNNSLSTKIRRMKYFLLLALSLVLSVNSYAQVSTGYTFSQGTVGTNPASGATANIVIASGWNDDVATLNFPGGFSFVFNSAVYTSCNVNSNGYITFGGAAPAVNNYNPISTNAGYLGAFGGMSEDLLDASATAITYNVSGTAPNRVFSVIWYGAQRAGLLSASSETVNFEINLYENTNEIEAAYGSTSFESASITAEIGLRGLSNADFNNRDMGAALPWLNNTSAGAVNTASVLCNNNAAPSDLYTYFRWTPVLLPCSGTPVASGATATPASLDCSGAPTLNLTTIPIGVSGITYQWQSGPSAAGPWTNIGGVLTNPYLIAPTISANTYYQCIVTCTNSGLSTTVTPLLVPVNGVTITPATATICLANSVQLTASTPLATSYSWTGNPAPTAGIPAPAMVPSPANNNVTMTPTATGVYTYTVTTGLSGACASTTAVVTVNPGITVTMTAGSATVCAGTSTTIDFNGTPNISVTYQVGAASPQTITLDAFGVASISTGPLNTATTYTLVSATNGTCTNIYGTSLTVNVIPSPVFSAGYPNNNGPICKGDSLILRAQTTGVGDTYSWAGPGLLVPDPNAVAAIPFAPVSASGIYTVTVTGTNSCVTIGTTTALVVDPTDTLLPLAPICSADPLLVLTGGSPTGGFYIGNGVTNNIFDPTYGTQTISYVFLDSASGCTDTSSQVQVVNPTPPVIVAAFPELCSNSLPVTLYGGVPQGGIFTGPDVVNGVFTQVGPGVYPIVYTYTALGCPGNTTQYLTVHNAVNTGLAGAPGTTETQFTTDILASTEVRYVPDCDLMAVVAPTGASPISGNFTVSVTIDDSVLTYNGSPYVPRHYNVESLGFPGTATATITLYAYQSEFDAYNVYAAANGFPLMPTGGVDNGNVAITQYHGTAIYPNNYQGPGILITPAVSWDATNNWWVMTFPVTGLSGFFVHSKTGGALNVSNTANNDGNLEVYPNPVQDKLTVKVNGLLHNNRKLSVTDLTGRVLIKVPMDNDKAIVDMSSLAAGMYMITYSDDERKETVKITKK